MDMKLPPKGKDLQFYQQYFRDAEPDGNKLEIDLAWIRYCQAHALVEARKQCTKKGSWKKFLQACGVKYPTAYAYCRVADLQPSKVQGKTWTECLAMVFPSFEIAPKGYDVEEQSKPKGKGHSHTHSSKNLEQSHTSAPVKADDPSRGIIIDDDNPLACEQWLDGIIEDIVNAHATAMDCPKDRRATCKAKVNEAIAKLQNMLATLDK